MHIRFSPSLGPLPRIEENHPSRSHSDHRDCSAGCHFSVVHRLLSVRELLRERNDGSDDGKSGNEYLRAMPESILAS